MDGYVMNIGIVTTWFESGAGYVSRQYRNALTDRHDVFIYCRGGERRPIGDPEWDGEFVTWGAPPMVNEPSAVDLDHFDAWLRQRRFDAVFFNEQRCWEPVLLCERRSVLTGAYVVHYTEQTIPLFDAYDFLICNTRHHYEVFQGHPQALFLPWGTDLQRFRRPVSYDSVRPGSVTYFLSVGLDPRRKGVDLVLEAFAQLRPGAASPRLVLHIHPLYDTFYEGRDRVYQESFLRMLESVRKSGDVEVISKAVPDVADLYRLGDICVYPTRHEGLGLSIAEALASGLPLIVSDAPPVNEHADGRVVRAVPIRRYYARSDGDYWPQSQVDVEALATAMQEVLDHPEQLPALKREARQLAEQKLDWAANASGLPDFFASVHKIKSERKEAALKEAKEFEAERTRLNVRNWAGARYPWMISVGRLSKPLLRPRTQGIRH
jgi:glycosyltransferase involved in cell wall biosynthesis